MAELVRKLVRGHFPCISAEVRPYFNDVADHVDRVQSMVDGLLQVLSTVFEFSSLLEAQNRGRHPPTCGMGRDPRSADSDCRHIRHELQGTCRNSTRLTATSSCLVSC